MSTPVSLITGKTGPYTNKVGGYGRNAAHNAKQFQTQPATPNRKGETVVDFGLLAEVALAIASQNPEALLQMLEKQMKSMIPANRPLPTVQYTEKQGATFPAQKNYEDTFGYSSESLKAAQQTPQAPGSGLPGLPKDAPNPFDKLKDLKNTWGPVLPLLKNVAGDNFKPLIEMIESIINSDPDEMMGGILDNNPMFENLKDMIPTGAAGSQGLDTDLLDRDMDGTVSLAEKAAETLFMDNSVNMLQGEINDQLNGKLDLQTDYEKAMAYTSLQTEMTGVSSAFDGKITPNERQWAIKAGSNASSAALVGNILDSLLINHDLENRALAFSVHA